MSEKLFPKDTHAGIVPVGTCLSVWKEGDDAAKANIGGCEGVSGSPGGSGTEQGEKQPGDKPISPLCCTVGGKATLSVHGSQLRLSSMTWGFYTHLVQLLREQPAQGSPSPLPSLLFAILFGGVRVVTLTRGFHPLPSLSQDTWQ